MPTRCTTAWPATTNPGSRSTARPTTTSAATRYRACKPPSRRAARGSPLATSPHRRYGRPMQLEGIHHITCVTADAPSNADFYVRVLGLRIVKKTINQTDQTTYHLFYGDEKASYGNNISFFEYRGRPNGRTGAGNVHTIVWRVGQPDALDFWERRLADEGIASERAEAMLRFCDPEGLPHELAVVDVPDLPLIGEAPDVPFEFALQGFDGVRAYARDVDASRAFCLDT